MSDFKYVVDSSLEEMRFTDAMKQEVLEKCKNSKMNVTDKKLSKQRFSIRYAAVVAACLVLCIGGTVAAKVFLWDDLVAKRYQVELKEEVQQETLDEGLVETMVTVAEDNGVTIEVLQTVATGNNIDIYLKIQAENEEIAKKLVDTNPEFDISFENSRLGVSSGSMVNYYTGEGRETKVTVDYDDWMDDKVDYEIYNISASILENGDLNGDTLYLEINNFVGNSQTSPDKVVEGSWELSWKIQASSKERIVELNKEYEIFDKMIPVDKVVLTETGVAVYLPVDFILDAGLDKADVYLTLCEDVGDTSVLDVPYESVEWLGYWGVPLSVSKNWTPEDETRVYEEIEAGTYQGEYIDYWEWIENPRRCITDPLDIYGIKMKDGSLEDSFYFLNGSTEDTQEYYVIRQNYANYLDYNNVTAIKLGNCWIELAD